MKSTLTTLWQLNLNSNALITSVFPTLTAELILRLEELGFEEDAKITCLKKMPLNGPKVYQIGDSIFSLTQEIASAVTIKPGIS